MKLHFPLYAKILLWFFLNLLLLGMVFYGCFRIQFHVGLDSLLAIVQMPPGIPVATVAINGARNAGILAAQIIATGDPALAEKMLKFKEELKDKIIKANEDLAKVKFEYKVDS